MKPPHFSNPQLKHSPVADISAAKFARLWSAVDAALDQLLVEARQHPSPEARQALIAVRNRLAQMAAVRPGAHSSSVMSRRKPSLI
jgi:hypothetical protein